MFDNLGTNVQPISDEEVLDIFNLEDDSKDKNKDKTKDKTKDKLPADKTKDKTKDKPSDKNKSKKTTSTSATTDIKSKQDSITDLADEDEDQAFDNVDDEDEDEDDENENKGKNKKKVVKKDDEDEDEDEDDDNEENDNEDDQNDNEDDNEDNNDEPADEEDQIKDFLKARAELLIKKGEWADYEGREDEDWTEERFEEIELSQRDYQKQQMTDEILNSFGPIGREIATFTANGGNPDDLLDIFKEQQRVESFSVDTEDSQKALVLKYETEFLGKKPERVKKYIDSLIADKELQAVATEAKEAMEASLVEQAETLQAQQEEIVKAKANKQKAEIQSFSANVTKLINGDNNIPADEKQTLIKVLTKYDKKLPNGTPVNEFYQKFAEFRKDLPNYIKLVRLVMNPEKFEKGLKTAAKNEAVEKAFKLARSSAKSRKIKSKDTSGNGGSNKVGTKFRLM